MLASRSPFHVDGIAAVSSVVLSTPDCLPLALRTLRLQSPFPFVSGSTRQQQQIALGRRLQEPARATLDLVLDQHPKPASAYGNNWRKACVSNVSLGPRCCFEEEVLLGQKRYGWSQQSPRERGEVLCIAFTPKG